MTRIRIAFWALLVGLPALWLAAETSPRAQPISGGIGIAPFISRMQDLEKQPDGKTVDFFHATVAGAVEEIERLRGLAERAHVTAAPLGSEGERATHGPDTARGGTRVA